MHLFSRVLLVTVLQQSYDCVHHKRYYIQMNNKYMNMLFLYHKKLLFFRQGVIRNHKHTMFYPFVF